MELATSVYLYKDHLFISEEVVDPRVLKLNLPIAMVTQNTKKQIFCKFLSNFVYLATALAEGVVAQLHSVHGELPIALPAHGHEILVLETDARRR